MGLRRSHNQDAYALVVTSEEDAWRERGHLFLVADGMGAHAVGELASKLAADLIPHTYQKYAAQGAAPAATASISTRAPRGSAATPTVARAGKGALKTRA